MTTVVQRICPPESPGLAADLLLARQVHACGQVPAGGNSLMGSTMYLSILGTAPAITPPCQWPTAATKSLPEW